MATKIFKALTLVGVLFNVLALQNSTASATMIYAEGAGTGGGGVITRLNFKWVSSSQLTPGNISCGTNYKCSVGVGVRYTTKAGLNKNQHLMGHSFSKGESWEVALKTVLQTFGSTGSSSWIINDPDYSDWYVCIMAVSYSGAPDTSTQLAPGSTCNVIPPVPAACDFMVKDTTLSYGILEPQATEGAIASTSIMVECSKDSNVIFKLAGGLPAVQLGLGLIAELQVGSKPLGASVPLEAGYTQILIASTLRGVASGTGAFDASAVLIVEVQ